jgi:enoyl-CoA hydratase
MAVSTSSPALSARFLEGSQIYADEPAKSQFQIAAEAMLIRYRDKRIRLCMMFEVNLSRRTAKGTPGNTKMYEHYEKLKFERRGSILTVTLNNPPVNAMSQRLQEEMARVFYDVERDDGCSVVVLAAEGKVFQAGGDLKEMLGVARDADYQARAMERSPHVVLSLLRLSKPTIARVHGHAMGLGATIALLCDVVIAADTALIGDPHVKVGLSAGDGGALLWPALIGYARARHYLLTGDPVSAVEAERIGLIYKATPADQLDAVVDAYADRLAGGAAKAISATKRSINLPLLRQAITDIEAHLGLELQTAFTEDHREGLSSFAERRAPQFRGR